MTTKMTPQEWMAKMDSQIMEMAKEINPVLAKYLKATVESKSLQEALNILEPKIALKDNVYFMADDYEGNGIVYKIDGSMLKVFAPATQKMYTVDVSLVEKVAK